MLDVVKWSTETEMPATYKENLGINRKAQVLCLQWAALGFLRVREKAGKYLLLTDTGMFKRIEEWAKIRSKWDQNRTANSTLLGPEYIRKSAKGWKVVEKAGEQEENEPHLLIEI